jgi:large subunit ribosomal protein L29
MKATKVRELDTTELQKQLQDSAEQIFRIRFQMGMGQTDGLKKYREMRKDRARILTVLKERGVKAESPVAPKATKATAKGRAAAKKTAKKK